MNSNTVTVEFDDEQVSISVVAVSLKKEGYSVPDKAECFGGFEVIM
jgi:hypothetical protein